MYSRVIIPVRLDIGTRENSLIRRVGFSPPSFAANQASWWAEPGAIGRKASASFLKKRSKKLLNAVARCFSNALYENKSFLVLFFKKEHSFSRLQLARPGSGQGLGKMILRWQYQSFRNSVRAVLTNRPLEMVFVVIGALLVIAYNAAGAYALLVDAGPMLRGQWPRVVIAGLATSAVLGGTIGFSLGRWASARARALWIAVLPWPDAAKKRSARSAALTLVAALGLVALALGWISSAALCQPNALLWGVAASVAFLVPAVVAAVIMPSS